MSVPNGFYRITRIEDRESISILVGGQLYVMSDDDPSYGRVCARILDNDYEGAARLFDKEESIRQSLEDSVLSDRIEVRNGHVFLDGEVCENQITDLIIDMNDQGEDYVPLANFFALLSDNQIHHSRHRLFDWLRAEGKFSLDKEGYLIGYKGLDHNFRSKFAGPGIVNGVKVHGNLDNSPGNVVEIETVEFDPNIGCAEGLHVGTFDYAQNWAAGGKLVAVRVSPADVGSVPTDANDAKIRCFKYEVIEEVSAPYQERIVK